MHFNFLCIISGLAVLTRATHPVHVTEDLASHYPEGTEWHYVNGTDIPALMKPNRHHNKRELTQGMYICQGANWSGPCHWIRADGGMCHDLIGDGLKKSMGPDYYITCKAYAATGCQAGEGNLFWNPGWSNNQDAHDESGLPKYMNSFKCHFNWWNGNW